MVYPPPSGTGQAHVDIREFLPRRAQPGDLVANRDMTVGDAFNMLAKAEASGVDLLKRDPEFAPFEQQRPVPVG